MINPNLSLQARLIFNLKNVRLYLQAVLTSLHPQLLSTCSQVEPCETWSSSPSLWMFMAQLCSMVWPEGLRSPGVS